jgi:hypothetical protein
MNFSPQTIQARAMEKDFLFLLFYGLGMGGNIVIMSFHSADFAGEKAGLERSEKDINL